MVFVGERELVFGCRWGHGGTGTDSARAEGLGCYVFVDGLAEEVSGQLAESSLDEFGCLRPPNSSPAVRAARQSVAKETEAYQTAYAICKNTSPADVEAEGGPQGFADWTMSLLPEYFSSSGELEAYGRGCYDVISGKPPRP